MSIERRQAKPAHTHPDLVKSLAEALDEKRSDARGPGIPRIIEEEQTFGNNIHVSVIWDQWEDIPHSERGPIILDAYRQQRGELEMLRITQVLGMTEHEAERHNVQ